MVKPMNCYNVCQVIKASDGNYRSRGVGWVILKIRQVMFLQKVTHLSAQLAETVEFGTVPKLVGCQGFKGSNPSTFQDDFTKHWVLIEVKLKSWSIISQHFFYHFTTFLFLWHFRTEIRTFSIPFVLMRYEWLWFTIETHIPGINIYL